MTTQAMPSISARSAARGPRGVAYILGRVLFWLMIAALLVFTLFPFYWAVITSIKPRAEIFSTPVQYLPSFINFDFYVNVFAAQNFGRAIINSAFVSITTVLLALLIGSSGAYALGRLKFRGKQIILYTVLAMTLFPQISVLGSLFTTVRNLGIYNTPWALILTYLTFTLPFTVWVMTTFFRSLPRELEQAALVDGATLFQTFYMILLPLTAPALVTTGLLGFIAAWNEFLYALTFTIDDTARTVPVKIAFFTGVTSQEIPWGEIMAASVLVTLPLLVLVLIFQKRIVEGLTAGAVKG